MKTPEVKPCPFCGKMPIVDYIPPHDHYIVDLPRYEGAGVIECVDCGAAMMAGTVEKAAEKWNRRDNDENA